MFDAWAPANREDLTWPMGNTVLYFNHVPGGSNVLYMDGHVEFLRYPSKFPVIGSVDETDYLKFLYMYYMTICGGMG